MADITFRITPQPSLTNEVFTLNEEMDFAVATTVVKDIIQMGILPTAR